MAGFTRETLKVPSFEDGVALDVWFFKPTGPGPFPVVVAGHGMTVIKDAGMAAFGKRWALDADYASLIFDYRYFGASDGEPRNFVSLSNQRQDFESIIRWVRQQPDLFLSSKIVLMGSAMSALIVTQLALDEEGLAGVMAHSPMLDGYDTVMAAGFNPRLLFWATVDRVRGNLGLSPTFIRAVGRPTEFALLNSPSSHPGFTAMFAQGETPFEKAPNLINPRVIFEFMSARPGRQLGRARCPVLLVAAKEDDNIPPRVAAEIARQTNEKVAVVELACGHFDIMEGGKGYDANIKAQIDFLRRLNH
ncbi:Alpha/Beta hydrolase protein [Roridomyces roridus]|uniref:Alpha/Beta hydrolase protein n=1 Tax=Roridomyces roridus TaxID=1738132 RepID=A0AAD7C3S1_9AGAR|nr:Alpha/Beta hydrolase protein [Roridomyces roridus]